MRNYISIIAIIIAISLGILLLRKKKQETEGLGRTVATGRPPKVRIVYSKKQLPKDRRKIVSSREAYEVLKEIWSKQIDIREEMIILLLDRSNTVLGYQVLSMGGITGTVADIRLLYSTALNALATGVIMSHNHPSGNMTPSQSDIELTRKVKEAGNIMEINLLDHLIISQDSYYSFADEGIL
ncbi:MAG: JAB domain-containing protein [Spirochaetes bacterium]|nr:JAB domain-containing protein [Spirochaetota bacterium]